MNVKEVVERLGHFGLDEREATVFYHLSRLGPSRASELARATDVKRTEVYRVMASLESHGLVEKTLERPRRFVPVDIDDALERMIERRDRELQELRDEREALTDAWPRVQKGSGPVGERFSVHQGRAQIRGLLERMVEGAREEILLVALKRGLARIDGLGVLDRILERIDDDVIVRVLTEIDETNRDTVAPIATSCEVRHTDLPGYHQVLIVDNQEVALFVSVDPLVSTSESAEETVLWLNAPDFILAQRSIFDTMWNTGLDHDARVEELESGQVAEQARILRGRWSRYEKLKDLLHRAEEDVVIVMSDGDVHRLKRSGIDRSLRRCAKGGARVRALVPDDASLDVDGVDERVAPEGLPRSAVLVDGNELLIVSGSDDEIDSVAYDGEWALWLTLRHPVERTATILDAAWTGAK